MHSGASAAARPQNVAKVKIAEPNRKGPQYRRVDVSAGRRGGRRRRIGGAADLRIGVFARWRGRLLFWRRIFRRVRHLRGETYRRQERKRISVWSKGVTPKQRRV